MWIEIFFIGWLGFGPTELEPTTNIETPQGILYKQHEDQKSWVQPCKVEELRMDSKGKIEFKCKPIDTKVRIF